MRLHFKNKYSFLNILEWNGYSKRQKFVKLPIIICIRTASKIMYGQLFLKNILSFTMHNKQKTWYIKDWKGWIFHILESNHCGKFKHSAYEWRYQEVNFCVWQFLSNNRATEMYFMEGIFLLFCHGSKNFLNENLTNGLWKGKTLMWNAGWDIFIIKYSLES